MREHVKVWTHLPRCRPVGTAGGGQCIQSFGFGAEAHHDPHPYYLEE